jgi:CRISPR/Cas system-associated exonuclease Cas4 (RecB family)
LSGLDCYSLALPTEWAPPPDRWSVTSLEEAVACPRRWQLLRSRWGVHEQFPVRQHPSAEEGRIVHEALDELFRACARRARPAIGTSGFAEAIAECSFFERFSVALSEAQARAAQHPRPRPGSALRTRAEDLANRAIRLFRAQYRPALGALGPAVRVEGAGVAAALAARGTVSEVRVQHPHLPLVGLVDLVVTRDGETVVVDHKTGARTEAHQRQVMVYALLFWRAHGVRSSGVEVQYLDTVERWSVSEEQLIATEKTVDDHVAWLADALASRPAPARPGPACGRCPVRARCDDGWLASARAPRDGVADLEVAVTSPPTKNGFLGASSLGEVAVVYDEALAGMVPPVTVGDRLRLVDAVARNGGAEVEVRVWTETFVLYRNKPHPS